ncbi:hypothetical protein AB0L10_23100 [Streptomyces flaveolus]|uniref:hypothetical protein n=1 Tax=Streptomyces flaveolus TaxID=67297 RepID=UPI00342D62B1
MTLAVIAGFWLMRKVICDAALNSTDETVLTRTLEQLFTVLVHPWPRPGRPPTRACLWKLSRRAPVTGLFVPSCDDLR